MLSKFVNIKLGVILVGTLLLSSGCSEDLYRTKGVIPIQLSVVFADTTNSLVSLTSFNGPNAELIKGVKNLQTLEMNDYSGPLPPNTDVLYINTDQVSPELAKSDIIYDALLANKTLLIDGSEENIEKYCTQNLPVFEYKSKLISYHLKKPQSADLTAPGESILEVTGYGLKSNALTTNMIQESIWYISDTKAAKSKPYPDYSSPNTNAQPLALKTDSQLGYDWKTITSSTIHAPNANARVASPCVGELKCFGSDGLDWGPWNWTEYLYIPCYPQDKNTHWIKVDEYGCHYFNTVFDPDAVFAFNIKPAGLRSPNINDRWEFSDFLKRQACWEDSVDYGAIATWLNLNATYLSGDKSTTVAATKWAQFNSNTCKSCYIDFWALRGKSKTWSASNSVGVSLSYGFKVPFFEAFKGEIFSEWGRKWGTSQSVSVSSVDQREFWVTPCMFQVSGKNRAGTSIIYGRAVATTLEKYASGYTEANISARYIREDQKRERYITYCFRGADGSKMLGNFEGWLRSANNIWVRSEWKSIWEINIATFKNCTK